MFDWSIPQGEGYEVYELYTEHDNELQGMIAIKNNQTELFSALVEKYFNGDKEVADKVKENIFKYTPTVDKIMSFGDEFPDGRLVEPWDNSLPNYNPRLVDKEVKRLGRQLTEEELEKCIIND